MSNRRREKGVEILLPAKLASAPTHGEDRHAGLMPGIVNRAEQIADAVGPGLDQQDPGAGRNGVGPLNVERGFLGPAGTVRGTTLRHGDRQKLAGWAVKIVKRLPVD